MIKNINKQIIIIYSFHYRTGFFRVVYTRRLSKYVSHLSLGIGFIFKAHIICLIVTVGYNPSVHSAALSSKNDLKPGCKYKSSVNQGSIASQYVCLVELSNLC
jgi:hypothetical protein